ncbi:MAG: hypothetical protein AB7T27_10215 [Kiritimatiellia bacterium]
MGFLLIIFYIALPFLLIGSGYYFVIRNLLPAANKGFSPVRYSVYASALLAIGFFIYGLHEISASSSSTAGLGYIVLPIYVAKAGAACFVVFWALINIPFLIAKGLRSKTFPAERFYQLTLAIIILAATYLIAHHHSTRSVLIKEAESSTTNPERLFALYSKAAENWDSEVLARLACNPKTSIDVLKDIYAFLSVSNDVPVRHHPFQIFYSLAHNRNTPAEVLRELAKRPENSVRVAVALNPNTPLDVLHTLAKDEEELVRHWVAANPLFVSELPENMKTNEYRFPVP